MFCKRQKGNQHFGFLKKGKFERTESCEYSGLDSSCFPDQDLEIRVGSLELRVRSKDELSIAFTMAQRMLRNVWRERELTEDPGMSLKSDTCVLGAL